MTTDLQKILNLLMQPSASVVRKWPLTTQLQTGGKNQSGKNE